MSFSFHPEAEKELNKAIEDFFNNHKSKECATYESVAQLFEKQPTAAQAKNVFKLVTKNKTCIYTASEYAKLLNEVETEARKSAQRKLLENNDTDKFDILKEHELLEWSRSDSPVRMYLREMGQIPLLTKEEEIEISKKIEGGESIIIDAICSVPYLINFILDYREPLINRERRVKELFKNFEDEKEDADDSDNASDVVATEVVEKTLSAKDKTRVEKVTFSFKALEKAKKEWTKIAENAPEDLDGDLTEEIVNYYLAISYKKKYLKRKIIRFRTNFKTYQRTC